MCTIHVTQYFQNYTYMVVTQYIFFQINALFQTQCFYTLSVHSDTYNKNIWITKKDNPTNNYIIILILTKQYDLILNESDN